MRTLKTRIDYYDLDQAVSNDQYLNRLRKQRMEVYKFATPCVFLNKDGSIGKLFYRLPEQASDFVKNIDAQIEKRIQSLIKFYTL